MDDDDDAYISVSVDNRSLVPDTTWTLIAHTTKALTRPTTDIYHDRCLQNPTTHRHKSLHTWCKTMGSDFRKQKRTRCWRSWTPWIRTVSLHLALWQYSVFTFGVFWGFFWGVSIADKYRVLARIVILLIFTYDWCAVVDRISLKKFELLFQTRRRYTWFPVIVLVCLINWTPIMYQGLLNLYAMAWFKYIIIVVYSWKRKSFKIVSSCKKLVLIQVD